MRNAAVFGYTQSHVCAELKAGRGARRLHDEGDGERAQAPPLLTGPVGERAQAFPTIGPPCSSRGMLLISHIPPPDGAPGSPASGPPCGVRGCISLLLSSHTHPPASSPGSSISLGYSPEPSQRRCRRGQLLLLRWLRRPVGTPAPHDGVAALALVSRQVALSLADRQATRSRLGLRRRRPLQLPWATVGDQQALTCCHQGLLPALADTWTCWQRGLQLALCDEIAASGGLVQTSRGGRCDGGGGGIAGGRGGVVGGKGDPVP